MSDDYAELDIPEVLNVLFHPRAEMVGTGGNSACEDILIPVAPTIKIGTRLHPAAAAAPTILFFHGNGEIVADYDQLGAFYTGLGINFWVVDYRGYGCSDGRPTVTAMMQDCHQVFQYAVEWLRTQSYTGPLIVMGRSLGSASALELAAAHQEALSGLIIESGFAHLQPLLKLLGADPQRVDLSKADSVNLAKIKSFDKPTLIIHAENDHIIPYADGKALYEHCGAPEKTLLKIPGANHNDLFFQGMTAYLQAVKHLTQLAAG